MSNDKKEIAITDQTGKALIITPQMVKEQICPTATDVEIALFLNIAKSYNLNPFKREIHLTKYTGQKANFIVGYEVYLKRAERTDKLDGWECHIEGTGENEKAVISIKRKDQSMPIKWEVLRREFDKGQATWKTMPTFMLKKVAIAQGFRLAFPEDLGGMPYIPEEIGTGTSAELPKEETETQIVQPAGSESASTPSPDDEPAAPQITDYDDGYKKQVARGQDLVKQKKLMATGENGWSTIYGVVERGYKTAEQKYHALKLKLDELEVPATK